MILHGNHRIMLPALGRDGDGGLRRRERTGIFQKLVDHRADQLAVELHDDILRYFQLHHLLFLLQLL
ncbi:MAG: hypothetical protein UY85_C0052G0009 [Candidatus Peribacteria bacterium GW2011_GWB1_54_5]|nr:MAG: hypothetical protein UY85_C0052G0009 [Candidatus Peribacteria bacterium GW2011_GWB1_54_5]